MKILFTGGGTGGHFYPIIAVSQALRDEVGARKLLMPELYYMAPTKFSPRTLFDNEINYIYCPAGKLRKYFSLLNFTDSIKTFLGIFKAIISLYRLYPDVVFGKGGYVSFPVLFAARLLHIPVIIHESDSIPGRVNLWAGKFAKKIALSYPGAAKYFKKREGVIAYTGNPVRRDIVHPLLQGAHEFLNLEEGIPVILIIGGSQGSQKINEVILQALPHLIDHYQIIHMTGRANIEEIKNTVAIILKDNAYASRYHPFDFLNDLALRMSAGVSDIIISRAGSQLFEIALWGKPSIIIPLPESISRDQTSNALAYKEAGACIVMEESNLSPHILVEEIDHIVNNENLKTIMSQKAKAFSRSDSAKLIADAILDIAVSHES
jgi:UDP-N-acetylglucosamine--N-acetylmuramyl-(pentapeptide) pyrophosphoryl-undecaprenol N-acetylglucosamine transferase